MRILLIVYDNDSHINTFPIGIGYLTSVLEKKYHVDIYHQDIHHYYEEHLTHFLDQGSYDVVGLSFIGGYYQYSKAVKLARAVNRSSKRPFFILGGHGPSPEPDFFMRKLEADAVCIGEGEETILDLLDAMAHRRSLSTVPGIAFMDGNSCVLNERRPLIADIDTIPFPAYHRFPIEHYRLMRMPRCTRTDFIMVMLSGRGCPFRCNFCYRMDAGFRQRGNEAIIEEIKLLKRDYGINYIAFYDELLMSSVSRTESLCEDFIRHKLDIKWEANGRLNFARPDLLKLMHSSGCVFLNYGIECFDDTVLKNMHKGLTTKQITRGVEATLAAGISPGLNMIFGNHGENRETLRKGVNFIKKYTDDAQLRTIRPVTPYPGCELYYDAIRMGKLKDCEDFYENKHLNSDLLAINFTELSDDEFYEAIYSANEELLLYAQERGRIATMQQLDKLYKDKDISFRGFRGV